MEEVAYVPGKPKTKTVWLYDYVTVYNIYTTYAVKPENLSWNNCQFVIHVYIYAWHHWHAYTYIFIYIYI